MRGTKEDGYEGGAAGLGPRSLRCQDLRFVAMINRRCDSIWTGKTKLSGYSVIGLAISTETDNSPSSRRAEIVNSLCGGTRAEAEQARNRTLSCGGDCLGMTAHYVVDLKSPK